jgi:hypothetical protein
MTYVKLVERVVLVGNNNKRYVFIPALISGCMFGIEFHFGEDLEPDDIFAMTIDFFIVRCTFVITTGDRYDNL